MQTVFSETASARAVSIIQQAFAWMFGGLLLTAVTALAASSDVEFQRTLQTNNILFFGLIIAEFALVVVISRGITRMSHSTAIGAFLLYAALTGVTLSSVVVMYSGASIAGAFLSTSLVFGSMALYGFVTKSDLSSMGSLAIMTLVGVIIATVVNVFLHSSAVSIALSYITILVFCGLTAWDVQRLKVMSANMQGDNLGIYGALSLYLDFINIFLTLLRLFGGNRR